MMHRAIFLFRAGLLLSSLLSRPSEAFKHRQGYVELAPSTIAKFPEIRLVGRGGSDGDDRRETFEKLLRQAQLDPEVLNHEGGALSSLGRILESPGPLPDLMTICTMVAVNQSDIFKDGMEAGKEIYKAMKFNFAKEFEEALGLAEITPEQQQQLELNGEAKSTMMIDSCIEYLGSDYLHGSFFLVENFRQQVLKNPFWQGLVKASLIKHLGDECPPFDEIIQDGELWSDTLIRC